MRIESRPQQRCATGSKLCHTHWKFSENLSSIAKLGFNIRERETKESQTTGKEVEIISSLQTRFARPSVHALPQTHHAPSRRNSSLHQTASCSPMRFEFVGCIPGLDCGFSLLDFFLCCIESSAVRIYLVRCSARIFSQYLSKVYLNVRK